MPHAHVWTLVNTVQLSLPGPDNYVERCIAWVCACGKEDGWNCEMPLGHPLPRPDVATALSQLERRQGRPHAQEAQRQERWRLR